MDSSPNGLSTARARPTGAGAEDVSDGRQYTATSSQFALVAKPVSALVADHYDRLTPSERVGEAYYDPNTGVVNERGWEVLDQQRPAPDTLVAHYSIEGVKYINDTYGHDQGQRLYQIAARALHQLAPDIAKVRGDFAGHVASEDEAHLTAARATELLPPELRGLRITAATGHTLAEAGLHHAAAKQRAEEIGLRSQRGQRPRGLAPTWSPETHPIPAGSVVAKQLPCLAEAHSALSRAEALAAYRDPLTGLMNSTAVGATADPRDYVVAFDLDGLKATDRFSSDLADRVLERAGALMKVVADADIKLAHPHGDEYQAFHPDPRKLKVLAEEIVTHLANLSVNYVDLHVGQAVRQDGIGISYGIGRTPEEAEKNLQAHKAARTRAGERDVHQGTEIANARLHARPATDHELAQADLQRSELWRHHLVRPRNDARAGDRGSHPAAGESPAHLDRGSASAALSGGPGRAPSPEQEVATLASLPALPASVALEAPFAGRLPTADLASFHQSSPALWVSAPPEKPLGQILLFSSVREALAFHQLHPTDNSLYVSLEGAQLTQEKGRALLQTLSDHLPLSGSVRPLPIRSAFEHTPHGATLFGSVNALLHGQRDYAHMRDPHKPARNSPSYYATLEPPTAPSAHVRSASRGLSKSR